jgi:hypothetical protein
MKTFYYMGHNPAMKSRVSWKLWKINRNGLELTTWWGPATVVHRKPKPTHALQTKNWHFQTEAQAKEDEERRIRQKLREGYKRMGMRRRS